MLGVDRIVFLHLLVRSFAARILLFGAATIGISLIAFSLTKPKMDIKTNTQEMRGSRKVPVIQNSFPAPDFSALSQRPLFHESRKPREVRSQEIRVVQPSKPIPPSQLYHLTGIVKTPRSDTLAYVLEQNSGDTVRLRVGDIIGDWTVLEIREESLLFQNNEQIVALGLK